MAAELGLEQVHLINDLYANAHGIALLEESDFVVLNPAITPLLARKTKQAASLDELLFSLISLGLIYLALLIVEVGLLVKYIRGGVVSAMPELGAPTDTDDHSDGDVLAFAY